MSSKVPDRQPGHIISRRAFLRYATAAVGTVAASALATACAPASAPGPTPAPTRASEAAAQPTPTSAPAKAQSKGKLSFWPRREFAEALNAYVEEQAKAKAEELGYDIEITSTPIGEEEQAKWKAAQEAGTLPDVGIGGNFSNHVVTGIAMDVSDVFEETGKANGGWFDWARGYVTVKGKALGFPYAGYPWVTYYWQTPFAEAGFKLPLKDFDQFVEAAKKITKPDKDFYAIGFPFSSTDTPMHVAQGIWGFGGAIQDKEGNPTLLTPETIAGVTWYAELYSKHKVVPPGATGWAPVDNNKFYLGKKGAVCYNLGSLTYALRDQDPGLLKDTYLGTMPPGPKGDVPCVLGVQVMIVNAKTQFPDAAKALAQHLLSPKVYPTLLEKAGGLISPTMQEPAKMPFFVDDPYNKPVMEKILPAGRVLGYPANDTPWLEEATSQNWWPEALHAIVLKGARPEDALADLQKKMEQSKAKFERAMSR